MAAAPEPVPPVDLGRDPARRAHRLRVVGAAGIGLAAAGICVLGIEGEIGRLAAAALIGACAVGLAVALRRPATVAAIPVGQADDPAAARRIAVAAHELRTPLNGILGFTDLLARTGLTPEQQAYVGAMRRSGTALLGLVDDVLDLGRLEAGRDAHPPEAVALDALVEDVVELLAPRAHAKGLELAAFVAPGLPVRVVADPLLLRQVLLNLGGNAVKFTQEGGVAVEVEPAPRGRIAFRIRDTGIGIAPADAERIFAEFERVAEPAGDRGGSGLGLAIARAIVERLGGEIRLDSRLGAGACFAFDLALAAAEPSPPLLRPLAGRRVLILAQGRIEPPLLLRRLHALGAGATLAASPDCLAPDEPFDVVLIDHRPGADAADALVRARAHLAAVPRAVVLIAPADRDNLERLKVAGFDGHLVRPIRVASLVRVLDGATASEAAAAPIAAAPAGRIHDVLLVDDNEINALLGRALLDHLGHRARVAADGPSALAEIAAAEAAGRPFAVVLMDLHMPGMDGFATIRALRARDGGATPFVVAVTADATPAAAARAVACGADATLVKPIDRDRLAALLAAVPRSAAPPAADRSAAG
ncbi:response regulator [Siculibacillus lacustris]|uniref:histidine kinase n=1 Tax=Siculibacillus lacustris TaxID=1549641 RepID=A0A4Q9VK61_9HYPH|nr:ATP-binding protein [Siculibacillus lacustris]TBW35774.1 response regulator [Siculibacillus lacustris]